MLRHDRLTAILDTLASRRTLSVDDIAHEFDVSPATARRDLDELATQRLLVRTRGGAVTDSVAYDLPLRYKTARQHEQKERIAARAATLVSLGWVVAMNGGTTTTAVSRELGRRWDPNVPTLGPDRFALTIVTNALNIANELAVRPHIKIVVPGGVARNQSYELIGPLTSRGLEDLTMDMMFLGVDALSPTGGAAANNEGEAEINRIMVQHARRVVVVADGSKLQGHAFCKICDVSDIDVVLTDTTADPAIVNRMRALGLVVETV